MPLAGKSLTLTGSGALFELDPTRDEELVRVHDSNSEAKPWRIIHVKAESNASGSP